MFAQAEEEKVEISPYLVDGCKDYAKKFIEHKYFNKNSKKLALFLAYQYLSDRELTKTISLASVLRSDNFL